VSEEQGNSSRAVELGGLPGRTGMSIERRQLLLHVAGPLVIAIIGGLIQYTYGLNNPPSWLTWSTILFAISLLLSIQVGFFDWAKSRRNHIEAQMEKFQEELRSQTESQIRLLTAKVSETVDAHKLVADLEKRFSDLLQSDRPEERFLGRAAQIVMERVNDELREMFYQRKCHLRAIIPTKEYIETWVRLMEGLISESGNVDFVTNLVIWSKSYMMRDGSYYLNMNVDSARDKGLKIRRIFVVPDDQAMLSDEDLRRSSIETFEAYSALTRLQEGVETLVYKTNSRFEYESHFNTGGDSKNFGIWKDQKMEICCVVRYLPGRVNDIEEIEFTIDRNVIAQKRATFAHLWAQKNLSVEEYLNHLRRMADLVSVGE
jgi:hypothetical protein